MLIKIVGALALLLILAMAGALVISVIHDIRNGRKPRDSSAVADKQLKRGSALLGVVLGLWVGK